MKLAVIGTGYVGLVAGACFADMGNHVCCIDRDARKVDLLRSGGVPIYEPGLDELVARNIAKERLTFTTDAAAGLVGAEVVFIAVGTPPGEDGSADLSHVLAVAEVIAAHVTEYTVVVCKSTVPVGTCDRVRELIRSKTEVRVDVVSNPEFLKEGAALADFQSPDRVVIGGDSAEAVEKVASLYTPFLRRSERILRMDLRSAEMTKYASNSMLATKISFINEIANLCDRVGADVNMVRKGMSMDERIGPHFIYPGVGYGGSCLVGKESVLVRRDGKTRHMTLRALFELICPDADDTPELVSHPTEGLEILSWAPGDEAPKMRPVQLITRRGYEGELYQIRTKMGRRLRVTADHPFVTLNDRGTPHVKLARELDETDWLPLARGRVLGHNAQERLDLLDYLEAAGITEDQVIVRLGEAGQAQLASLSFDVMWAALMHLEHPRGRERVYDIHRHGQALRLDEARALGLPLEDITLGTARNGTYVPRFITLNPAFFRMLGLYLAEGHIAGDGMRRRITWSFHPTREPHLVDEIASFWSSLGVKVDVRPGTTTMQVLLSSRVLAGMWQAIGAGTCSYDHTIPDLIWDRDEADRMALLSGLWHGDGSWSLVNGGPSVVLEYGTVSRPLADGMVRLLADLGVIARVKVGRAAKSTRDTYWLVLSSADNVERMIELVHPAERPLVLQSIEAQAKRIAPTGTRERGQRGAVAARIDAISHEPWQGLVYSLEVPDAHTFVTSFGLITHNCFPKDVRALTFLGHEYQRELQLLAAVEAVNNRQKERLLDFALGFFGGDLSGKKFAMWGLSFKPNTDDVREASALATIRRLIAAGATVVAHDPVASDNALEYLGHPEGLTIVKREYDALAGADGLFLMTEWNDYRSPDFTRIKATLNTPVIFDGRNLFSPSHLKGLGITYFCIGRATVDRDW